MKFSITKLFQFIFRTFMIFILIFIWIRYYSSDLNYAVSLSLFITFLVEIILRAIRKKRTERLGLKENEIALATSTINKLVFNSQSENVELVYKILQEKENVKKQKDFVLVTNSENKVFALYPAFSYSDFDVDCLAKIFQKVKNLKLERLIILTRTVAKDVKNIAKKASFDVMILQSQEVYARIFKAYNYTPSEEELFKIENVSSEVKFKDIIKGAISSNKTKSYFFSSVILLFASYFVAYKIYYLTIASILLVLSIVSFTSIWWKKTVTKNIF